MDLYDDLFLDSESNNDVHQDVDNEKGLLLSENRKHGLAFEEKRLKEENQKLKDEINALKRENENWQLVYCDVARKLENSRTNVTTLLKTTQNEIKRKNDTISGLKRELDNIMFKRALKSGTVNELKGMAEKIHKVFQFEINAGFLPDTKSPKRANCDEQSEESKKSNVNKLEVAKGILDTYIWYKVH